MYRRLFCIMGGPKNHRQKRFYLVFHWVFGIRELKRSVFVTALIFILILTLGACKKKSTETAAEAPSAEESPKTLIEPLYLEGLSATSTASGSTPENLFDGKSDTNWVTRDGAGPDDGVMISFGSPRMVSKITVQAAAGNFCPVKMLSIYANGSFVTDVAPGSAATIGEEVSNIYVRISETDDVLSAGNSDETAYYTKRKGTLPCALSEIILTYDNGVAIPTVAPLSVRGSVSASSTLTPAEAYGTDFLFDSSRMFGWAEGGPGEGAGETLTFSFDKKQKITGLRFWNGYQRSDSHFTANARVKSMLIKSGSFEKTFELADEPGAQSISFGELIDSDSLTLTVNDVYPGEKYKDLVISEILFTAPKGFIRIESGGIDERSRQLLARVKGTVLEKIVDQSIKNNANDTYTSLCLRSNNSFVIYYNIDDPDNSAAFIYDGNWQIEEATAESAKLRIFGKKLVSVSSQSAYSEESVSEMITIFSDNLTVTPDKINAEKSFKELVHNF